MRSLRPAPPFQAAAFVHVGDMSPADGELILDRWLTAAARTLSAEQRAVILGGFAKTPRPLYLKLCFQVRTTTRDC